MKKSLLYAGASAFVLISAPACAADQSAPGPAANAPGQAAAPAASAPVALNQSADQSSGLQDIIVTASRREQSAQKLASSIVAISGSEVTRQGVVQAEDLNNLVPGLGLASNGAITQVYLRGVGTFSSPIGDSSILVQVDDVVMGEPAMFSGHFYDLQRVEVLKGPQGTLYGRNATAGAINVVSNRPNFQFGGDATAEYGNYNAFRFAGAVNVPASDTLAFRLAGQIIDRGGYFTDGAGNDKSQAIRSQMLFQPSTTFSFLLSADYFHQGGTGSPNVPIPFVDPNNPRVGPSTSLANSVTPPPFSQVANDAFVNVKNWGVHAEIKADLGFATLTIIPAYRQSNFQQTLYPGFRTHSDSSSNQKTLEARLSSPSGGTFKWILGGYYYDESSNQFNQVDQGIVAQNQIVARGNKAYAGFGEVTYSIIDPLRLVGGIRYTHENRTINGLQDTIAVPGPTGFPILLPPGVADFAYTGRVTDSDVSYKAGVEFDVAPKSLLYATVSTGFRAGGLNTDTAPNTFKPEKLTSYTIGMKNRFFNDILQANFELFYWDYKNHQENALLSENGLVGGLSVLTLNADKSTVKGVNLDLKLLATSNDLFSTQIEYLDAKFDRFVYTSPQSPSVIAPRTSCAISPSSTVAGGTTINCSGKPFTRAPRWSANVAYQHTFRLSNTGHVIAGTSAQFASGSYFATDYIPAEKQGGYAIVNADLTYEAPGGRWSIAAFGRNLSNATVINEGFEHPFIPQLAFGSLRPPRTYGGTLKVKF